MTTEPQIIKHLTLLVPGDWCIPTPFYYVANSLLRPLFPEFAAATVGGGGSEKSPLNQDVFNTITKIKIRERKRKRKERTKKKEKEKKKERG